jgi:hypothetical protein
MPEFNRAVDEAEGACEKRMKVYKMKFRISSRFPDHVLTNYFLFLCACCPFSLGVSLDPSSSLYLLFLLRLPSA